MNGVVIGQGLGEFFSGPYGKSPGCQKPLLHRLLGTYPQAKLGPRPGVCAVSAAGRPAPAFGLSRPGPETYAPAAFAMSLRLFNTLTRRVEPFAPLDHQAGACALPLQSRAALPASDEKRTMHQMENRPETGHESNPLEPAQPTAPAAQNLQAHDGQPSKGSLQRQPPTNCGSQLA
jgi:hypothetical protein